MIFPRMPKLPVSGACLALAFIFSATSASADLVLNTVGVAETIDFTGFDGTAGFTSNGVDGALVNGGGQLNSDTIIVHGLSDGDFNFGDTATTGDYDRGNSAGGVTTGGAYNFDTGGGNDTLGVQPAGSDFTPGEIYVRVRNETGGTINGFDIDYDALYFNDQGRANSLLFAYATSVAAVADPSGLAYVTVPALDVTSPEAADAVPAWVNNDRMASITGLSIGDGEYLYLRFLGDDVSGAGSRDEFAIDNISVTAVPEPSSLAFAAMCGMGLYWRRRRESALATVES